MRAFLVIAVVAGCAGGGEPIRGWTLDVADGPRGVEVALPSSLVGELPMRDVAFVLHASVPVAPALRGQPLTLQLDCYHGDLAATANGVTLEDRGDLAVGEHRFVIPASEAATLALTLEGHHDLDWKAFGFGASPRLERGIAAGPGAAARFDRYAAIAGIVLCVVMGLLFATLFALDRRALASFAFAVQAFAALSWLTWELGACPPPLLMLGAAVMVIAILYFLHLEFELGPPPRWLVVAYAIYGVACPAVAFSFAALAVATALGGLLWLVVAWHLLRHLVRVARHGPRRQDARVLLAGLVVDFVALIPLWTTVLGVPITAGFHVEIIAIVVWPAAQALILAREHVARHRELEATAAELRRQVAERSKDLSDALAKLAARPTPVGEQRVIDGRYRVVRKLGAGGMGAVHEVERLADGQRLALKTMRGHAEPELMARFAREAQLAASLDHANLLPVIDVGIADGALFLVMPLVEGGSLERERARFGERAWARPLLAQIARGLAALHAHGIVHRDLKPANVLLARGVPRIADFGLATARAPVDPSGETVSDEGLTSSQALFGTPKYMAPELVRGVRDVQPSADVFAFGVIAYEMMTGKPPFELPLVYARLEGRGMPRPAPSDLEPILKRCLDLVPEARPTAAELVAALA